MSLPPPAYQEIVRMALAEDIGAGDVTSLATIPATAVANARMVFKGEGVVCGLDVARAVFAAVDGTLAVEVCRKDGDTCRRGDVLLNVMGNARAILAAERVALNFVQRLSGIASETAKLCALVAGTAARVTDTRKTTPGLRALEKYAVACGGGVNHRMGLHDAILIKDNHIAVAGGVTAALAACKAYTGKVEIEVDTLAQLDEALEAGARFVLLDNMSVDMLRESVTRNAGRALLEASGGITPLTIRDIAMTGVDVISVGWITHSAPAMDVGLDIAM